MSDFKARTGADSEEASAFSFRQLIDEFQSAWEAALRGTVPPDLETFVGRLTTTDHQDQLRDQLIEIENRYRRLFPESRSTRTSAPIETVLIEPNDSNDSAAPRVDVHRSFAETIDPNCQEMGRGEMGATTDGLTSLEDRSHQPAIGETVPPVESDRTTDFSIDAAALVSEPATRSRTARGYPTVPGYEILGELGRGGMGVVYRAKQLGLNRHVALKMILSGAHAAPQQLVRFRAEGEAVAQLQHSNIVQIYDVGELDGLPFFSLEFVGGGALDQLIKEKPLIPHQAASIVDTIARAMHYAHQRNIVHRDLKPANILLTPDGQPKITDFGLVKRLEDEASQTRTGTVMGTPSYMAPEQARGDKEVGPLADVYALGSILYCLLTGRPPFMAASAIDTVMQVLKEEPVPPRRLQPKIPVDLDTVCLKCLQKEPSKRYASALELAEDLRRFLAGAPILARPIATPQRVWRWCRRNPRIAIPSALAMVLLLVLLIGGWAGAAVIYQKSVAETKAKKEAEQHARVARQKTDEVILQKQEVDKQKDIVEKKKVEVEQALDVANQQRNLALDTLGSLIVRVQPLLQDTPKMQQLRQELLDVALTGLSKVAERSDGVQDSSVLMASARRRMGELFLELGHTERATLEFKRCHQIVTQLAEAGTLPNPNANLATSYENLGLAARASGELNEALEHLKTALDHRRAYYEESQKSLRAMDDLAKTLGRIGATYVSLGQNAEALRYYSESMQLREDDAERSPNEDRPQQELAGALSAVGQLHLKLGDSDKAVSFLEEAIERLRGVANRHQEDRSAQWNLYLFEMQLASLKLMLNRPEEALGKFQEVNSSLNRLRTADPDNSQLTMHLSQSFYGLGIIQEELGEKEEARTAFAESLRLRRQLVEDDEANVGKRTALMLSLARSGEIKEAATGAEKIELGARDAAALYSAATVYAVCAGKLAAEPALADAGSNAAEEYASKAVIALRAASERGFQLSQEQLLDPDLRSLRGRPDFEALFARGQ